MRSRPTTPQRVVIEEPSWPPPRLSLEDEHETGFARGVSVSSSHDTRSSRQTVAISGIHGRFLAWQRGEDLSTKDAEGKEVNRTLKRSETMKSAITRSLKAITRSFSKQGTTTTTFRPEGWTGEPRRGRRHSEGFSVKKARELQSRAVPMPEVPSGFRYMGEFVEHLRRKEEQDARRRAGEIVEEEEVIDMPEAHTLAAIVDGSEGNDTCWDDREAALELHIAAREDDAQRIRILLAPPDDSKRIPVDLLDPAGETAALVAARDGCVASVAALLDGGADPMQRDLHHFVFGDAVWPNEHNPDPFGIDPVKMRCEHIETGRTVLYHLRLQGTFEAVLKNVFPLTRLRTVCRIADAIQQFHLKCPLIFAAQQGYVDLMALLVAHVAQVQRTPLTALWSPGASPRYSEADSTTEELGPHWRPSQSSCCQALLEAVLLSKWQCAEVLLAGRLPRLTLNETRDKHDRNVLHIAACAGRASMVKMLLQSGASTAMFTRSGMQPLHYACSAGHRDVVQALLEGGADPNIESWALPHSRMLRTKDSGKTPMGIAKSRRNFGVMEVLCKAPAVQTDQTTPRAGFSENGRRQRQLPRALSSPVLGQAGKFTRPSTR